MMGKGNYNGGGTLLGFGRKWSDHAEFPKPEAPAKSERILSKKTRLQRRKISVIEELTAKEIGLAAYGAKLPRNPLKRGPILKKLVLDGLLLQNGRPNANHPKIQAWANSKLSIASKKQRRECI